MIKIIYSTNALKVIKHIKDFNKDDFELYLLKQGIGVGHTQIIEYLIQKEQNNGDTK